MRRLLTIAAFALCAQLFAVGSVAAAGSKIATAMGDLRWGMSEHDVRQFAKRYLTRHYEQAMKKARGAKKNNLRQELDAQLSRVQGSAIEFTGSRSRWDSSPVAGEFTYGNSESMLTLEDTKAKHFYFFINGELWKWVKVLPPGEFGGKKFNKFESMVGKRFGNGMVKSGARLADREDEQKWVEFLDRQSRLRAVDQTAEHGSYALVFEDMSTVRDLSSLRLNVPKRRPAKHAAKAEDAADDTEHARPAVARKKRSSIFAGEQKNESDDEYEKRRKRAEVAQQAKRRLHERKQREKRNGADLAGVSAASDSDDPLAGL